MRRTVGVLTLLVLLSLAGSASAQEKHYNSYMGQTPPEITTVEGNWINSGRPHTLEDLRGRLVYLEFSFLH